MIVSNLTLMPLTLNLPESQPKRVTKCLQCRYLTLSSHTVIISYRREVNAGLLVFRDGSRTILKGGAVDKGGAYKPSVID